MKYIYHKGILKEWICGKSFSHINSSFKDDYFFFSVKG